MRVLRVVLGMMTLLLAMPVLAAGAVAWWAMQHRSPDGAFHADLAPITSDSRIVVVPDVDAILRRDAPIARADQTELRLKANSGAFVGMAAPGDLATYLAGVGYTELFGAQLGRGPLAVQTKQIVMSDQALAAPGEQPFWVRGGLGELRWSPSADRERHVALIVIAPPGEEPVRLSVAVTAGWLNSTTWGLLTLGPILLMLGLAALAWPQRPREIVYVVDSGTAAQAGLPSYPGVTLPVQSSQVYFAQSAAKVPSTLATEPKAELAWPPPEAPAETEPVREVSTEELPSLPEPDPDRPMPTAGMHLHLTRAKS